MGLREANVLMNGTKILNVRFYESQYNKSYSVGLMVVPHMFGNVAMLGITGQKNIVHIEIQVDLFNGTIRAMDLTPRDRKASRVMKAFREAFGAEEEKAYYKNVYDKVLSFSLKGGNAK